jgi:hypothetical protein
MEPKHGGKRPKEESPKTVSISVVCQFMPQDAVQNFVFFCAKRVGDEQIVLPTFSHECRSERFGYKQGDFCLWNSVFPQEVLPDSAERFRFVGLHVAVRFEESGQFSMQAETFCEDDGNADEPEGEEETRDGVCYFQVFSL